MRAIDGFGPRGAQLAVARVAWTYTSDNGLRWDTPAPRRVLNARPRPTELLHDASGQPLRLKRDLAAEADARDALWSTGLHPLPAQALQWRTPEVGEGHADLWSLPEEPQFGDFWAEQVPRLQALGWSIVVQPGFAHLSVAVDRWRLVIDPVSFDEIGRELAEPLGPRVQALEALRQPPREGSFLLSLGTEVDGEMLDLAPLLADLLKRDARWLKAHEIAAIDDAALIVLHAPGGRRIEAPAAPLKAIIGAMLDLLTDPRRKDGPLQLSTWEAQHLEALRMGLADTHTKPAPHGPARTAPGSCRATPAWRRWRSACARRAARRVWTRRSVSAWNCVPASCKAWPGCSTCARSTWRASWPTTWGWARPHRCWRIC